MRCVRRSNVIRGAALLIAPVLATTLPLPSAPRAEEPSDVETLYVQSCSVCHGRRGEGLAPDDPRLATFSAPPLAFTDPLFTSREPGADWFMVIKHGGDRMGLSAQMPGYGAAFTDEQIEALVGFIKGLADTEGYPPGDLNFPRAIDTIKAFPEDELILQSRYAANDNVDDSLRMVLEYARRFGKRYHAEAKLIHVDDGVESELEALELGVKWAFFHNLDKQLLLTAGFEGEIPFDDGAEVELVPYFSFAKGLSEEFTLQGGVRGKLPADDLGAGEAHVSAIVHWIPSPWPRSVIPGLEATLTLPFESGVDETATVIPQIYVGLNRGGHVALSVGVELPLTDEEYDYRARAFLLWDFADGPFWAGW